MKKICVVTSTRADYSLLLPVIKELKQYFEVRIVATGTHLSIHHGTTFKEIEKDFAKQEIDVIDLMLDNETSDANGTCHIIAKTLNLFSLYFSKNKYDLTVLLGDRFEIFAISEAAYIHNIPIAHLHGGELTEGVLDDGFRHSITKLATWHFAATEKYRQRIIQLGENPSRVFTVGAPGLDSINTVKTLNREELHHKTGINFNIKNLLITFHPVTLNEVIAKDEALQFFSALMEFAKAEEYVNFFITMPNNDQYSIFIEEHIEKFKKQFSARVFTFKSLGLLNYINLMREVDVVVGNSSSGIIEAPFLGKHVLNIGNRQLGRLSDVHVVHCECEKNIILSQLKELLIKKSISSSILYGDGTAAIKIAKHLSKISDHFSEPKRFFDLKISI
jgi:GDP/UDP-N,N'-diacetylbacillosamine 2-epimerase (hydrolysing)